MTRQRIVHYKSSCSKFSLHFLTGKNEISVKKLIAPIVNEFATKTFMENLIYWPTNIKEAERVGADCERLKKSVAYHL